MKLNEYGFDYYIPLFLFYTSIFFGSYRFILDKKDIGLKEYLPIYAFCLLQIPFYSSFVSFNGSLYRYGSIIGISLPCFFSIVILFYRQRYLTLFPSNDSLYAVMTFGYGILPLWPFPAFQLAALPASNSIYLEISFYSYLFLLPLYIISVVNVFLALLLPGKKERCQERKEWLGKNR